MNLIILLFTVFFSSLSIAQSPDDLGKISLHIVMPTEQSENFANLKSKELNKVRSKITSIVSKYGISGSGEGNFVIYPIIDIYDEEKMATGMDNLVIIRAEFSLVIKEINNGQIYGSCSVEIEGTGRDRNRALSKCIQSINTRDSEFKNLIEGSKAKIINYYESKCSDIKIEAESHSKRRDYSSAIATLMQVPEEVGSCYREISEKCVEYYNYHIELECQEKIQAAKVAKTRNNWDDAVENLLGILPHFECYSDAMKLLQEIEDHRCSENLGKAKGAWAKGENAASVAAMYLAMIPTDSKCSEEANQMSNDIRQRLNDLEKRSWDLEYEKYNRQTQMIESALQHAQDMEKSSLEHNQKIQEKEIDNRHTENMRDKEVQVETMDKIKDMAISVWKSKAKIAKANSKKATDQYNYNNYYNKSTNKQSLK
tara:strand:+ start:1812 stop:3092 length:1281 start_codon:yes stop_codon:yes gene_type:complete